MTRLEAAPPTLAATRADLHAIAEWVLGPARFAAEGHIGLRATPGGFGTPPLPGGRVIRVDGVNLVVEDGGALTMSRLLTLRDAALAAGIEPGVHPGVYDPATAWEPDRPLELDPLAADCLARWFAFTCSVLETMGTPANEPSEIQLWPEHFDLAMDVAGSSTRVNLGGSPGDGGHPLPYLYVGPWQHDAGDPFWNEPFGSSLDYVDIARADDQEATALAFLRAGVAHA